MTAQTMAPSMRGQMQQSFRLAGPVLGVGLLAFGLLFHAEVVRRDGRPAGYIRSASYGFTLGGAVGLAMIDADEPINQAYLDACEWTVQIGDAFYPATVSLRPMYDPRNERIQM